MRVRTSVSATDPFPATPDTPVGAPGRPTGVTGLDGAESGPVPAAFTAATVKV